jgi:peptide/nickel transport system ATP-binding protein
MSVESACSVTGLRVQLDRGGPDVVDEITFEVFPGEVLALVGESGSGKTTVGTALLAHARRGARIVGGSVDINGTELLGQPANVSRRRRGSDIAYVPQDPTASLNPVLRVGYQIREVLDVHDAPDDRDERVREVLDEVALPSDNSFLRRYPHQLSGGQAQRVVIAMAFALRPKVLVLDEPTTGLDVTNQAHVLATVKDMCERHRVATVYITHDLAVVAELAHRVAVLYAGQIVELGGKEDVFAAPRHPYTRALLAAVPSVTEARVLTGIAGHAPAPGRRSTGCRFHDRCDYRTDECATTEPPVVTVDGVLTRCLRSDHVRRQPTAAATSVPVAENTRENVLEVTNLTAWYGRQQVLHEVGLTIPENGCVALVGESGSGKSTLSRCIGGLHTDWAGAITFDKTQVPHHNRSPELRKRIQYVFQNPYLALNPRMTVNEIIRRPLVLFGQATSVAELLDQVSLPAETGRLLPARLSGGERQRVAIARALACEPDLLVCDEVTSALDVSVQASIIALLDNLRKTKGLSMLFVTHNLALVRSIATETVVLAEGRVVESGRTDQVLDTPKADYTRTLLANTPHLRR